jgi:hypothetical protein
MKIIFKTSQATIDGSLNDSEISRQIYEKLPIDSKVNTWAEEIYFPVPVNCKPENPTLVVKIGDIAYWPEGKCLCIFFGRTPISTDDQPKPASEVNIVGKIKGDLSILKKIKDGDKISVKKL